MSGCAATDWLPLCPLLPHHSAEDFFQASLKVQPVLDEAQARAAASLDVATAQVAQVGCDLIDHDCPDSM